MGLFSYLQHLRNIDKKLYLKSKIFYHAAPTIFSDKPSTIITLDDIEGDMFVTLENIKKELIDYFGVYSFVLNIDNKRCTVILYKQKELKKVLDKNMYFLESFGYNHSMSLEEMVNKLKIRFNETCPHEMGIFLGIPLEDVKEFMCNNNNCKLCGYWKVYHNIENAKKVFEKYDRAKEFATNYILNNFVANIVA